MNVSIKSMVLTNGRANTCLDKLQKYTSKDGLLGYAIARNIRILSESLTEYLAVYKKLANQYGTPEIDADGNKTGRLKLEPEALAQFTDAIEPYASLEYQYNICTVAFESCVDLLNAEGFLDLDFMLSDPFEKAIGVEDGVTVTRDGSGNIVHTDRVVERYPNGVEKHEVVAPAPVTVQSYQA